MNKFSRVTHPYLSAQALRLPIMLAALAAAPLAMADTTAQATDVEVSQPAPNVQVQQPAPQVSVEAREPQVNVRTNEAQVSIEHSEPEIKIDQPEPEVTIQQAEPEIVVNSAEPQVEVVKEEPQVEIIKADPEVNIVRQDSAGQPTQSQEQLQAQQSLMNAQVSDLNGKKIYNANGDELGEVNEVVTRKTDNELGFILSVGGLLGIGATDVFVPASETQLTGDRLQWNQAKDKDSLKQSGIERDQFEAVSSDHETLDDAYDSSLVSQ